VDQDFINWNGPVCSLARSALRSAADFQAEDAAPFHAAGLVILGDKIAGQATWRDGLARLARAGRGQPVREAGEVGPILLRDELGHRRALYFPLSLRLHLSVAATEHDPDSATTTAGDASNQSIVSLRQDLIDASRAVLLRLSEWPASSQTCDVAIMLWNALTRSQALSWHGGGGEVDDEMIAIDQTVDRLIAHSGPDGSLHEQGVEDTIDAWTFRELTGLHALADLAVQRKRQDWLAVVRRVALHHLHNTQPDHITTQPWAAHAFSWWPDTMSFARQQIHDASLSGVATGRASASPVIGAILADAVNTSNQMAIWTSKSGILRIED
jgi:hypothetical protein